MECLTATKANKALLEAAEAQISSNLGLVNSAGTTRWDVVKDAVNDDISYLSKPPVEGWGNSGCPYFTQEQMLAGVDMTDITEMDFNPAWKPEAEA